MEQVLQQLQQLNAVYAQLQTTINAQQQHLKLLIHLLQTQQQQVELNNTSNNKDLPSQLVTDSINGFISSLQQLGNTLNNLVLPNPQSGITQNELGLSSVQLETMQNELNSSNVQLGIMQNEFSSPKVKSGITQNKFNSSNIQLGVMQNELDLSNVQLGAMQNEFNSSNVQLGKMQNELDSSNVQLGRMQNELDLSNVQLGRMQNELDLSNVQLGATQNEFNSSNVQLGITTNKIVYGINKIDIDVTKLNMSSFRSKIKGLIVKCSRPSAMAAAKILVELYKNPKQSHSSLIKISGFSVGGLSKHIAMLKRRGLIVRTAYQQYELTNLALQMMRQSIDVNT